MYVFFDNLLQQNNRSFAFHFGGNRYDPGENGRDLYGRKVNGVFMFFVHEQRRDVQCFIPYEREWAGGVHRHRGQYGIHLFEKVAVDIGGLVFREVFVLCNNL